MRMEVVFNVCWLPLHDSIMFIEYFSDTEVVGARQLFLEWSFSSSLSVAYSRQLDDGCGPRGNPFQAQIALERLQYYSLAPSHSVFRSSEGTLKLRFREMCGADLKV